MPNRQVTVLQITTVNTAAPTVCNPMTSGLTMSVPMVKATAVPVTNTPATFSTAAITTAWSGESTRVATTVAIALGASVKPLVNSAARTISSTMTKGILMVNSSNPYNLYS